MAWIRVSGGLLLAKAAVDRISDIDDVLVACRFVVEVLAAVSRADAVRLDLPREFYREPIVSKLVSGECEGNVACIRKELRGGIGLIFPYRAFPEGKEITSAI